MIQNQTVAAVSTPHGRGGIAVIRISGPQALAVAARCFIPAGGRAFSALRGGDAVYGMICDGAERLDDGILTLFRAPHSYTGEDVAEISCHGGILNTRRVLEAVLAAGAEPAGAGEFTRRAFLAGKLSLTEAEAVADLIDAQTEGMRKLSRQAADGRLSGATNELYEELVALTASVYAIIDYPEEDLSDLSPDELRAQLTALRGRLDVLLTTYRTGRAISEGVETTICGSPNVGKSAIYNYLLGEDRAIVTEVAGTTRDLLYGSAAVGDVRLNLCDTAGLRESDDRIEQAGIARARERAGASELVLLVLDGARCMTGEEREIAVALAAAAENCIVLINKSDLPPADDAEKTAALFPDAVWVSAQTGAGFDALTERIAALYGCGDIGASAQPIVYNARQYAALRRAAEGIDRALAALAAGFAPDVASVDIEIALGALGECDGRAVGEDIVRNIFSRFCVGK